jgi:flagellin-like hook-associated protein FlgL
MDAKSVTKSDVGLLNKAKPELGRQLVAPQPQLPSTADQVSISRTGLLGRTSAAVNFRESFNAALSKLNVASDVTTKISEYVSGIKGMLELAADPKTSPGRVQILEQEAKALVSEISEVASKAEVGGTKLLAGDPIVLELENNIGKTLRVLLPSDSAESFGLKELSFAKADMIIQTRAAVERAARQVDELRRAVERASSDFSMAGVEAEVALQNGESSNTSVRDLDQAVDLVGSAVLTMRSAPKEAIASNSLTPRSLNLLDT